MTDSEFAASNAVEFSVSELSNALKRTLEDTFGYVRVRGEISGYRGPSGSGHVYFSLKDAGARLDAVIWRGTFLRMRVKPEEGLEVVATGRITAFAGKSSYQIIVDSLEPAGVGALMALLDARRRALEAEGLFDSARKKRLPFLPSVIGVVTSPTGAVIRDILHRLSDRFPVHVVIWPVRVQGETAAMEVAAAIRGFNALEAGGAIPVPDALIVARGGGSLQDLWSFNEEIVVRAAFESRIPLVSAVGHETDTTLIDYAADVRAPTPTAAAELAVPVRAELLARLASLDGREKGAMLRLSQRRLSELRALARALPAGEALLSPARQRLDFAAAALNSQTRAAFHARAISLERLSRRLSAQSPRARTAATREKLSALDARLFRAATGLVLRERQALAFVVAARVRESARSAARRAENFAAQSRRWAALGAARDRAAAERASRLAAAGERLERAMRQNLQRRAERLASRAQLLEAVGYHSVLARGFALVRDARGAPVRRAAEAPKGGALSIEFADGKVAAVVAGGGRRRARGGREDAEGQGRLL